MANNISCDAHDYFEIVFMRRSYIKVTTKDNKECYGIATDIKLIEQKEFLQISKGIKVQQLLLSEVKKLEAIGNKIAQHNFSFTI